MIISMYRIAPYAFISLLLVILQTTLIPLVAIKEIVPDLIVVWVVYLAIREGQLTGTLVGFGLGLMLDLLSGHDGMLGLSALAKTVCGFCAGYFYDEERTTSILGGGRFISAIAVASLLHYAIYFLIFLQGSSLGRGEAILLYALPATAYTVLAGLTPMLVFRRLYLS